MCIISAKAAGVAMPDHDTIKRMWNGNSDGAGIMYVENGKVRIEKGFMSYKSFASKLEELEKRMDLTATPLVMHFRITTHGGTKPENCHPFPITDSVGALSKLVATVSIGVAHNGIIRITPRKGISDTMEYIITQLAPLKRAMPRFYENKNAMLMVKNAIDSKMAFLTKEGKIYTIGDFVEENGVLYSNSSFRERRWTMRDFPTSVYGGWDTYEGAWDDETCLSPYEPENIEELEWLDETDYVVDAYGKLHDSFDFLQDCNGDVWMYDYESDCALYVPFASAFTEHGMYRKYNADKAEEIFVNYTPVDLGGNEVEL